MLSEKRKIENAQAFQEGVPRGTGRKKRGDWGGVHRRCNFFSDVLFPILEGGYMGVCYISL